MLQHLIASKRPRNYPSTLILFYFYLYFSSLREISIKMYINMGIHHLPISLIFISKNVPLYCVRVR